MSVFLWALDDVVSTGLVLTTFSVCSFSLFLFFPTSISPFYVALSAAFRSIHSITDLNKPHNWNDFILFFTIESFLRVLILDWLLTLCLHRLLFGSGCFAFSSAASFTTLQFL